MPPACLDFKLIYHPPLKSNIRMPPYPNNTFKFVFWVWDFLLFGSFFCKVSPGSMRFLLDRIKEYWYQTPGWTLSCTQSSTWFECAKKTLSSVFPQAVIDSFHLLLPRVFFYDLFVQWDSGFALLNKRTTSASSPRTKDYLCDQLRFLPQHFNLAISTLLATMAGNKCLALMTVFKTSF